MSSTKKSLKLDGFYFVCDEGRTNLLWRCVELSIDGRHEEEI